ncbi:type I-E CRISPR-associated protein Cse2/CasB [Shimia sp. R9_3]|uniref:type I-E CRISPR-associated protein Cse2/CasB n=1 Tax=Shimia sp. R9_3 TaxID=2821113 RepID=UPI001AD9BBBC|nr:type I-E CRISPR-associated protein Cse2/CasB [Shimia sp. R9_3]MBO9401315.1 type I-E CRISPR-associated protein Cse2/CasB [Shimia sp. R9_3]
MSAPQDIGSICYGWWAELTAADLGRMRAEAAQLRRASTLVEVLTHPATHRLHQRLAKAGFDLRTQPQRLALIVMVLAQVRSKGRGLARALGQGDSPALSHLRFDRLIRTGAATTDDAGALDLAQQLRRALAQVNNVADVSALARDLYWWNDRIRANWCFDYYGAAEAAPHFSKDTNDKTIEETGV